MTLAASNSSAAFSSRRLPLSTWSATIPMRAPLPAASFATRRARDASGGDTRSEGGMLVQEERKKRMLLRKNAWAFRIDARSNMRESKRNSASPPSTCSAA